jgi:NAD(P)H-hydrate epimerase
MQGAAVLAGLGAARSGAGLVVLAGRTMPMAAPYDFVQRQVRSSESPFSDCDSVVVGPGLGTEAAEWLTSVRQHSGPGVIDADGLRLIEQLGTLSDRWVLTPHPKECARLLQWRTDEVQAERIRAARTLAAATGAVVVLKGYRTIVAHPDQRIRVISTGDASLATAGTGDVLAGMIGGFLAQGMGAFDAATVAAHLHGLAGELAGRERSKASVMATDVVEFISRAILLHFDREPEESL